MHGISKEVYRNEVDNEKKKPERRQKINAYIQARDKIFEKMSQNEYDDEGLQITWNILVKNPDIYTFWNYRKKAVLGFYNQLRTSGNAENDQNMDKIKQLYERELELTTNCLVRHPKSYSVWYHRYWTAYKMDDLCNHPGELYRCDGMLMLDERNFHCWDYMRAVYELGNSSIEFRINHLDSIIKKNFSNFSAWHYRNSMLKHDFPYEKKPEKIESIKDDLKMAMDGMFTDPDDQSSFLYRNRVLTQVFKNREYTKPLKVTLNKNSNELAIYFNKEVALKTETVRLICNMDPYAIYPMPQTNTNSFCSRVWVVVADVFAEIWPHSELKLDFDEVKQSDFAPKLYFRLKSRTGDVGREIDQSSSTTKEWLLAEARMSDHRGRVVDDMDLGEGGVPEELINCLKEDLTKLEQLVQMDGDKKWPLLSLLYTMRYIDVQAYSKRIKDGLEKLKLIDPMRTGYYNDLMIQWNLSEIEGAEDAICTT